MSDPPAATRDGELPPPRELTLLATLAVVQFTHIVDFMIMMPLGPQFMRLFDVGPGDFALLVSAYTFSAAAASVGAAFVVDRYDRKRMLLAVYAGFVLATAACGLAPGYGWLLVARIAAGAFGGVLGGLVLAIVADVIPYARRARANALVATAFALASVAGLPLGITLAAQLGWRAPFLVLALASAAVAFAAGRVLPPLAGHLEGAVRRNPLAQLQAIFGVGNHLRAFAFMLALMLAGFTVIPFIAPYQVVNVGIAEADLAWLYFAGGLATLVTAQIVGRLADRYGKKRVFAIVALASVVPLLVITNLPRLSLGQVLPVAVLFFILVPGRFGPAMALISGSAEPRMRGSFMSFNAAVQQLGAGISALIAGAIIGRAADGSLTRYGWVGALAVAFTLIAVALSRRIKVVDAGHGPD